MSLTLTHVTYPEVTLILNECNLLLNDIDNIDSVIQVHGTNLKGNMIKIMDGRALIIKVFKVHRTSHNKHRIHQSALISSCYQCLLLHHYALCITMDGFMYMLGAPMQ